MTTLPKPRSWRSHRYRQWIRQRRCLISGCRSRDVDAAHVGVNGKGLKADDYMTVPLCRDHHREQHDSGIISFQKRYGVWLFDEAKTLWTSSPWATEIREWRDAA